MNLLRVVTGLLLISMCLGMATTSLAGAISEQGTPSDGKPTPAPKPAPPRPNCPGFPIGCGPYSVPVNNQVIPNPELTYISDDFTTVQWTPISGPVIEQRNLYLTAQDGIIPTLQSNGQWTFDVNFIFDYLLAVRVDDVLMETGGTATAHMIGTAPDGGGNTRDFDIELLSLNISSSIPTDDPTPFLLRESPTLASTGKFTIEDVGGGQFVVQTFFDVFTEVSLDGGQSWLVAQSQVPEPGTTALLLSSGLLLVIRRRR